MGEIKNILVTGSNGFLGSHIITALIEADYRPILLLRSTSDLWRIEYLLDKCDKYIIDNPGHSISKLYEEYQIDGIIHTATDYGRDNSWANILRTNVIFPVDLIEQGVKAGIKVFINTDSFFAKPIYNQEYLKHYTRSKRLLEEFLKDFGGGLKIFNLRLEHVYGEDDAEQKFVTSIIKRLLMNDEEILLTEGQQKRDFIYVKDVVNGFIAVLDSTVNIKEHYQEFQLGTGKSISVRGFIEHIAQAVGSSSRLKFGALPNRKGDIEDSVADIKRIKELGWTHIYDTDQAIKNIVKKEKIRFGI